MTIPQLPVNSQLPPDLAGQLAQLQMRQQLSQALLGQSIQPTNPTRTAGRYVVPISPLEGFSKMATTALLSKGIADTAGKETNIFAQANQRRNSALSDALMGDRAGSQLPPGLQVPNTDPTGVPGFNVIPGQPSGHSAPSVGGRETLRDIYAEATKLAPQFGTDAMTILGSPLYEARIKAAMKDTERTDLQKNFADPSLADWQRKETFIPPTIVRDRSIALDPLTNKPILNNPDVASGTYNIWEPGNPNPVKNVPIPGAAQNVGDVNYMKLYQDAMAKLEMMKNPQGQTVPKTQASLANLPPPGNWVPPGQAPRVHAPAVQQPIPAPMPGAAPAPEQVQPPRPVVPAMPMAAAPPQAAPVQPNAVQTRIPMNPGQVPAPVALAAPPTKPFPWQQGPQQRPEPGVYGPTLSSQEEQSQRGKDLAEQMKTIDNSANSASIVQSRVGEMRELMKNFTPGALTPLKEKAGAILLGLGVKQDSPLMKQLGDVGDMQTFGKLALNLAFEQTKQLTNRPAASEVMLALKANPNIALTPQGIGKIMDYMDAMSDYQLRKQQLGQDWKTEPKGPKSLEGFDAWFNNKYKILDFLPKNSQKIPETKSQGPQFTPEEIDAEMRRRGLKGAPSGGSVPAY